jgi:hypothetical protein
MTTAAAEGCRSSGLVEVGGGGGSDTIRAKSSESLHVLCDAWRDV